MRNSQFFCRVIFAHRFCVYSSPLCHFYIRYNVLPTEYGKLKLRLLTEQLILLICFCRNTLKTSISYAQIPFLDNKKEGTDIGDL